MEEAPQQPTFGINIRDIESYITQAENQTQHWQALWRLEAAERKMATYLIIAHGIMVTNADGNPYFGTACPEWIQNRFNPLFQRIYNSYKRIEQTKAAEGQ